MPNGISHLYQLDERVHFLILGVFGGIFHFNQILIEHSVSKQWRP